MSIPRGENGSFVRLCLYLFSRGHYFVFCSAAASDVSCAAAAGNELLSVRGGILRSFFVFVSFGLHGSSQRFFRRGGLFLSSVCFRECVVGDNFTKIECNIVERTQYERMMWNDFFSCVCGDEVVCCHG